MRDDLFDFADRASEFLQILSGRVRLRLFWQIFEGGKSVRELAQAVGSSETSTSQQLAVLRSTGIVSARRDGQKIYYSLLNEDARRLLETLRDVLQGRQRAPGSESRSRSVEVPTRLEIR
jgi:DNA-binding transcriptional ArsR family regulator